jgi:hypothetical protein
MAWGRLASDVMPVGSPYSRKRLSVALFDHVCASVTPHAYHHVSPISAESIRTSVGAGGRYLFDFVATAKQVSCQPSQPLVVVLRVESSERLGGDCHFSCI